eukprot:6652948-Pyramimonas_sp.AAC.1
MTSHLSDWALKRAIAFHPQAWDAAFQCLQWRKAHVLVLRTSVALQPFTLIRTPILLYAAARESKDS